MTFNVFLIIKSGRTKCRGRAAIKLRRPHSVRANSRMQLFVQCKREIKVFLYICKLFKIDSLLKTDYMGRFGKLWVNVCSNFFIEAHLYNTLIDRN